MLSRVRLDKEMVTRGLVPTRSQAESLIRLQKVQVDGRVVSKPGEAVYSSSVIRLLTEEMYVSRAGLKLASVAKDLQIDFTGRLVLDVGSSTGGFTDFALRHGASKVIAVDVGTDQLHPSLRSNPKIELHEQTDIRNVTTNQKTSSPRKDEGLVINVPDIVVIDVSFISLRDILPHISRIVSSGSQIVAMCKPQFEAGSSAKHKGVIKNDRMRRDILKDFEVWLKKYFIIIDKADSEVAGAKGNRERFYLLKKLGSL